MRRFLLALFVSALGVFTPLSAGAATNASNGSACTTWLRGIDVSSSQPNVNWPDVKSFGISFAYVKTTQGLGYVNPYAPGQETGAVKAGIPFGNYDFAFTGDNPVADAKYFVLHSNSNAQLPPVLDLEVSHISNAATIAWAVAWIHEVEGLTSRTVTVYTGAYYGFSQSTAISSIATLWIAGYPYYKYQKDSACGLPLPRTGVWPTWVVWQFSDFAGVFGAGNLDGDVTTAQWLRSFSTLGVVLAAPKTKTSPAGIVYTLDSSGPEVVLIQHVLHNLGIYKGAIDGKFSEAVLYAVEIYEGPNWLNMPASERNSGWTPLAAQKSLTFLKVWDIKPISPAALRKIGATGAAARVQATESAAAIKAANAKAAKIAAAAKAAAAKAAAYAKAHPTTTTSTTSTTVPGAPVTTTTSSMAATGNTTIPTSTMPTSTPSATSTSLPSSPSKGGGGLWFLMLLPAALIAFIVIRIKGKK